MTVTENYLTDYGFIWEGIEVERTTTIGLPQGDTRVLTVKVNKTKLTIYVSPTGRSIRVFKNGKELKP